VSLKTFKDIEFPFFGLYKKPENISFTLNKIYVNRTLSSHKETVDDKSLDGDYFARLLQINNRLQFDCTCKDLQQLIFERPLWGMDSKAIPFDLSERNYHVSIKKVITKIKGNLIWVDKISYPFKLPTNENLEFPEDTIYATLISVNSEWYIKNITSDDKDKNIRKKILL
jgi:hypothetical protein